jgi:hypothetical protein
VGGIESVTLSDDEARRRGTQKTVLERRAPPTFDVLIEIQTRDRLVVHEDVSAAVDGILRGNPMPVEVRSRNELGEIDVENMQPETSPIAEQQRSDNRRGARRGNRTSNGSNGNKAPLALSNGTSRQEVRVYAYGVARNRLQQAARRLHVPATLTDDFAQADAVVTLKNYYRRRPRLIVDAERRGTPIYVLRANTVSQMENFLADIFQMDGGDAQHSSYGEAMQETEQAIMRVLSGEEAVDLTPQSSEVRRHQHAMAAKAQLFSRSFGREPQRHVRIQRDDE